MELSKRIERKRSSLAHSQEMYRTFHRHSARGTDEHLEMLLSESPKPLTLFIAVLGIDFLKGHVTIFSNSQLNWKKFKYPTFV